MVAAKEIDIDNVSQNIFHDILDEAKLIKESLHFELSQAAYYRVNAFCSAVNSELQDLTLCFRKHQKKALSWSVLLPDKCPTKR